jgi:hypothetical protein
MGVSVLLHHALLVGAWYALVAAGLRVAGALGGTGLARAVAGFVLAAATAAAEALLLGLSGLRMSTLALVGLTVAVWLCARLAVPSTARGGAAELAEWWSSLGFGSRVAAGALAGAAVTWVGWQLRYPALGYDMLLYHLPEAVAWSQDSSPGSVVGLLTVADYGAYTGLDELMLAWSAAVSRSFVAFTVWTPLLVALTAAAAWLGLRRLAVPPAVAALGTAALVSIPVMLGWQSIGGHNDVAAAAWVTACGALLVASRDTPGLLVPAFVAAGLALGTKTTVLPLALPLLGLGLYIHRRRLRSLAGPLAGAAALAGLVGGWWYLRNLIEYGSPLWPFYSTPWGDPVPAFVSAGVSFIDRPIHTVQEGGELYLRRFGGGIALLAGALLIPMFARRREVLACAATVALCLLLWTMAPYTGVGLTITGPVGATRYLLPTLAAAVLTLGLAARLPGAARALAMGVLGLAVVVNVVELLDLDYPVSPSWRVPLAGAALGAIAVAAASRIRLEPALVGRAAAPLAAVALAAGLALAAPGYLDRHADAGNLQAGVLDWLTRQPGFDGDGRRVAGTPIRPGILAGPRLQHGVDLIPLGERCQRLSGRLRDGWVVLQEPKGPSAPELRRAAGCLGRAPDHADGEWRAWSPSG